MTTAPLQSFHVNALCRGERIYCGEFCAHSVAEALAKAKKEKGAWVAKTLNTMETNLTWEIEEDF